MSKWIAAAFAGIGIVVTAFNANAQSDSTSLNIGGYRQAMQQQGSTGAYNAQSRAVVIPNQTVYVVQPTQTTYITQNGTVQCSSYKTVQSGWRDASVGEMQYWSRTFYGTNCGGGFQPPSYPFYAGTVRNDAQGNVCQVDAYRIPVYTIVCAN